MEQKRKLLVIRRKALLICGPTATGKTNLGLELAKKFSGEIISADSRQVYQGMGIGTGKDLPVNSKFQIPSTKKIINSKLQIGYYVIDDIKVWLYDIVRPDYQFNVSDYVKCADLVLEDIWRRGKLPIVVGGTGLYIKGLVDGIEMMNIKPDLKLRQQLNNLTIEQLKEKLLNLNKDKLDSMNNSDRNNPRRLIRAIEIANAGKMFQCTSALKQKIESLWIGLTAPYSELYKRIDQRVEERMKMGMEGEVKSLLDKGYNFENSILGVTMGYKEWIPTLRRDDIIARWKNTEHAYARRQMTWFKKEKRIKWFNLNKKGYDSAIEKLAGKWYNSRYAAD